jgi:hypothetical protein
MKKMKFSEAISTLEDLIRQLSQLDERVERMDLPPGKRSEMDNKIRRIYSRIDTTIRKLEHLSANMRRTK